MTDENYAFDLSLPVDASADRVFEMVLSTLASQYPEPESKTDNAGREFTVTMWALDLAAGPTSATFSVTESGVNRSTLALTIFGMHVGGVGRKMRKARAAYAQDSEGVTREIKRRAELPHG